jgi:Mn-dependent DtxR family transcriptional regulator
VNLEKILRRLQNNGLVTRTDSGVALTDAGHVLANRVLRSHRLWETYLTDVANVKPDHTHTRAHRLEHVPGMAEVVAREIHEPTIDPQSKPIPPASSKLTQT